MSQLTTYDCPIAANRVTYQLRSGQALGEPQRPYVRCSERDCQYVDVNEPPCPLHVALFDRTDEKDSLEAYLVRNIDRRICFACVVDAVGVTHEGLRRLAWRLRGDGVRVGPGRCDRCRHRRVTITAPTGSALTRRWPQVPAAPTPRKLPVASPTAEPDAENSKITVALGTAAGPTCTACLALAIGMPLDATRNAVNVLAARGDVVLKEHGMCSVCTRRQVVAIRRVPTEMNGSVLS